MLSEFFQISGLIGPVSVGINAAALRFYSSGVFDYPQCQKLLRHAVLAVGYGVVDSKDYWLIKNSWGKNWGEHGYVRMRRNRDQQCGISLDSLYPLVV